METPINPHCLFHKLVLIDIKTKNIIQIFRKIKSLIEYWISENLSADKDNIWLSL